MFINSAYILGKSRFFNLDFVVNSSVLVPRYDTETLVREAMNRIKSGDKVLDLCTGSGVIAVVLAKNSKGIINASDISKEALTVAQSNAAIHNAKVKFIHSDMFENIEGKFDIIVSNPPYVMSDEIGIHDPQTLKEPRIALDGGTDGLDFYRIIASQAKEYLVDGGIQALEIGYSQAEAVKGLLNQEGWSNIELVHDEAGRDRVIVCKA